MQSFMLRYHIPAVTLLMASVAAIEIVESDKGSLYYIIPIALIILAIHSEIVGICVAHRNFRMFEKERLHLIGYILDYLEYLTFIPCYYLILKNNWVMPDSLIVLVLPIGTFIMSRIIKHRYDYLIYQYDSHNEPEKLSIKESSDGY